MDQNINLQDSDILHELESESENNSDVENANSQNILGYGESFSSIENSVGEVINLEVDKELFLVDLPGNIDINKTFSSSNYTQNIEVVGVLLEGSANNNEILSCARLPESTNNVSLEIGVSLNALNNQSTQINQDIANEYINDPEYIDNVVQVSNGRKQVRFNKRKTLKKQRHSSLGKHWSIACNHNTSNICSIKHLSENDLEYFFNNIYNLQTKIDQDKYLLNFIDVNKVKRIRRSD